MLEIRPARLEEMGEFTRTVSTALERLVTYLCTPSPR